jgi:hypothetical protein
MDKPLLKSELDKLLNEFTAWDDERRKQEEARSEVTSPLHHYTDMASLVGIVQKSKIWLTSTWHLNDPSELTHGSDIANWHLMVIGTGEVSDNIDTFCRLTTTALETAYETAFNIFVTSFSQTPNDLAQWRAYADDGRGVAIEVSPEWFKPDLEKAWVRGKSDPRDFYSVSNVVYDEELAKQRQTIAIDKAIDTVKRTEASKLLHGPLDDYFLTELRVRLGVPLLWNSITTKHPAYEHEAETRLLLTHQVDAIASHVCSRTRGSELVSYVPIDFPIANPGMLKRIWIGPAAAAGAERGVADLLRAHGMDADRLIERSTIPYRSR